MNIIQTVKDIFSGDNTKIDYTQVSHSVVVTVIVCMWVWKSWQLVGALADFPQGVVVVLCALIGAVPASGFVNMLTKNAQTGTTVVQTQDTIVTTSQPQNEEDPKP